MKTHTIPQYTELKCDYEKCHKLANFYYEKIFIAPVQVRQLKLCPDHLVYHHNNDRKDWIEIPYVDMANYGIKCLRCSNRWQPRSFNKKYIKLNGKFMRLPGECPECGSKIYRENSIGESKK